jgi:CHAT domain-containing protein
MSLWTVPDMATAEFMKRFYGTLKEGKDIETSFIQTQQHMRQQYNDPFYWAGFVLVR